MMQWEDHRDIGHPQHLGLTPELSPPIPVTALPPLSSGSVSLKTPAPSEALSWVAAWGRMAAAQGSQSAGASPSSPLSRRDCTSVRRRLPDHSLTCSVGSPELPVRKAKSKRAASETGCGAARRRKAKPAHTVAYGESHKHIRARLAPPPTATHTPPPAPAQYYAPDGTSTTFLPQLPPPPPQQQRPQPLPQSPPQVEMNGFLSPFATVCHAPLSTPRKGEAATAKQRELEREELWLAGGAKWQPLPAAGGASGWQAAAQADLLGCMDAAEMEALDAALETLNEMISPMSFWL
ncbi:hypothetical protein D9Q98_010390 [Chlorella vulgaris]|uniref:Uncharacterized protein n=1 Tax=Chlorella vulgaris TaxID=3077 RepID=A0A9D4YYY9_CHLVU|nr:hypothetical protein D9Q98_010390 [Chlorella vulgaris]